MVMLFLVIALKYGVVSRIVKLNQKLRDAENLSKRHGAFLERKKSERKTAEREEMNLTRQQVSLESEMNRLDEEWSELKNANTEVLKELLPGYSGSEEELLNPPEPPPKDDGQISKN
jgi:chromosome segregation ATPase